MKFELDEIVWYMHENRICGAPILSRMLVENLHSDWDSNPAQRNIYRTFGKSGSFYATIHGRFSETVLYSSKEELLSSL